MENTNPQPEENKKLTIEVPTSLDGVIRKRPLISASYGLAILFFFFSFFVIKCNNQKIASLSGIDLVTGKNITGSNSLGGSNSDNSKDVDPNIWAIIALGSAVVGLGVYLFKAKGEELIGGIVSSLGVVALGVLYIDSTASASEMGITISISTGFGYWGALFFILIAGILSFLRLRIKKKQPVMPTEMEQPTSS